MSALGGIAMSVCVAGREVNDADSLQERSNVQLVLVSTRLHTVMPSAVLLSLRLCFRHLPSSRYHHYT